jgi:CheY-like chemotaxis protein
MNLCTNAAHAMRSAGGKLSIGLSDHDVGDAPSNKLAGIAAGGYVRIIVSDTGKGMDAGTLERIFEPYFSTKEKGEGTGLGLFVVHGIVQRFGGWVDVKSEPGQGTTFTIGFPRIDAETDAASPETTAHPTGTETVLVVDDDENIVAMTSEMLGNLGYRVAPATSADAALELFERIPDRFSVVITDQTMPGMTGEALVARMRRINPAIPVILCTGYSETMNAGKAQACGIDGFLMKPVEMADLAHTIRQVIDRSQLC